MRVQHHLLLLGRECIPEPSTADPHRSSLSPPAQNRRTKSLRSVPPARMRACARTRAALHICSIFLVVEVHPRPLTEPSSVSLSPQLKTGAQRSLRNVPPTRMRVCMRVQHYIFSCLVVHPEPPTADRNPHPSSLSQTQKWGAQESCRCLPPAAQGPCWRGFGGSPVLTSQLFYWRRRFFCKSTSVCFPEPHRQDKVALPLRGALCGRISNRLDDPRRQLKTI
jgi:hypothetical protein